jgi:hypothetical protein
MDPETGRIKPFWEVVAGGTAGGCQVVSTGRSVPPMGNSSICCAGFHEPTRNCVGAIGLALNVPYSREEPPGRSDYKCRAKQPK